MKPHMHVTGYSTSPVSEERCYLQIMEQPRRVYLRARWYGLLESVSDKVHLHKTNRWFEHMHLARCHNDCKYSSLTTVSTVQRDGTYETEDRVLCNYDPPALRLELHTRYLEYTDAKALGSVEVSKDEYNRIFFDGRKVV